MKNQLFLLCFVLHCAITAQTLPPVAQALYNDAVAQDAQIVQYAINAGAQIIATPDDSSFYIQWFPAGPTPANSPVIVTLHGSDGYAFHEFKNWHQSALQHGCGIIALQWYRGPASVSPNDYFNDSVIYNDIDTALTRINYPSNNALLHGFSRGAARSYAVNFEDIQSGNNYFCTTISNAGGADLNYPLYSDINSGVYGNNVFASKRWALYCGAFDSAFAQSGCIGMSNTQNFLLGQGATVDVFFQDPVGGHGGFHDTTIYRDSILEYYLQCFNGSLGIEQEVQSQNRLAYPNPCEGLLFIPASNELLAIKILTILGETALSFPHPSNSIDVSALPPGVYIANFTLKTGEKYEQKVIKQS